jgi:sugar phosphate isomerase/epimerase
MSTHHKPTLSWNPIRFIPSMIADGVPTLSEWFAKARSLNLTHVELYFGILGGFSKDHVSQVRGLLDSAGLSVSMFTAAPDFTHPEKTERVRHFENARRMLDVAAILQAPALRVTAGCLHDEVSTEDGIAMAADYLARLTEYSEPMNIQLAFENHYKDRLWTDRDFAHHTEIFLEIYDRLLDTPVKVNFDMSNQLMSDEDPLAVLDHVRDKIVHIHANDRHRGSYQHAVCGEGDLDFDGIFSRLAAIPYTGCISLEDGTRDGDAGTEKSFTLLREKIEDYYQLPIN